MNLEIPVYMQTTQTRVFGLFMGNKAWLPDLQNAEIEITLKKVSSTKKESKLASLHNVGIMSMSC